MVNFETIDYQQIACAFFVVMLACFLGTWVWIYSHTRKVVREKSKYYNDILKLNNSTDYNRHIRDVSYVMRVKSKAQFDRTHPSEALNEYLTWNRDEIRCILEGVQENRRAYADYITKYNALSSSITPLECEELRIPYKKFVEIENQLAVSAKISIIQTIAATCYVEYRSPQGRNY